MHVDTKSASDAWQDARQDLLYTTLLHTTTFPPFLSPSPPSPPSLPPARILEAVQAPCSGARLQPTEVYTRVGLPEEASPVQDDWITAY